MRRVVIDTNLYIDWLNAGRHEGVLFQRDAVEHLSAVVMLELCAGAVVAARRSGAPQPLQNSSPGKGSSQDGDTHRACHGSARTRSVSC